MLKLISMSSVLLVSLLLMASGQPVVPEADVNQEELAALQKGELKIDFVLLEKLRREQPQLVPLAERILEIRTSYEEHLAELNTAFAAERDPERSASLQRQVHDLKLLTEIGLLEAQLVYAPGKRTPEEIQRMQESIDAARELLHEKP